MLREVKTRFRAGMPHSPEARKLSTVLSAADKMEGIKLRWGIGRNSARVPCGLYYAGKPKTDSPILVTSNYRLTFDSVRKELGGLDVWLLVIDTTGINVWCAAGKGTFSHEEIERKMKEFAVDLFSPEGVLVLPQLAASGVNSIELSKRTGRIIRYGPVYARDIKAFLASGLTKTEAMSTVEFTVAERISVIPVELVHAWPLYPLAAVFALLLALPHFPNMSPHFVPYLVLLELSILCGTLLFPVLLPVLPFRFFSMKGAFLAFVCLSTLIAVYYATGMRALSGTALASVLFAGTGTASYLAMNYTGSSTFTCQTGAELEVKRSLPPILVSILVSLIIAGVRFI